MESFFFCMYLSKATISQKRIVSLCRLYTSVKTGTNNLLKKVSVFKMKLYIALCLLGFESIFWKTSSTEFMQLISEFNALSDVIQKNNQTPYFSGK